MSIVRTLIFILLAGKAIFAQQIFFCKSVDTDGKPVEHRTNWEIKTGSPITILFSGGKPINSNVVYLFIDKMSAGNYEAYDSKALSTEKNSSSISYQYNFTESGNYSIYFINNSGERLVQGIVIVRITEKPVQPAKIPVVENAERQILDAQIIFCEKVVSNKPVNVKESVSLKNGGTVTLLVQSSQPFNTRVLNVHIYKKKSNSLDDLVQTKKFAVKPSYLRTFFTYKFDSPGEYRFAIYDEVENIIKSASIFVTQ